MAYQTPAEVSGCRWVQACRPVYACLARAPGKRSWWPRTNCVG